MRREGNWTGWAEMLAMLLAVSLVVAFFGMGMLQGRSSDTPADPEPSAGEAGEVKPGVPTVPLDQHEMLGEPSPRNPDRQLDVRDSEVTYPKGLSEDLSAYWDQDLEWRDCDEHQCTTVKAPLDWENPGQAHIELAVRKVPSKKGGLGPLFLNPGGPGADGQSYATSLGVDAYPGYDLIGWDTRGTGESTSVQCGTTEQIDAYMELDASPDDEAEEKAFEEGTREFARQCRQHSGALLDHLTTIEVVRDLDLLRHLLGAPKLNYLGVSNGTYLGAMYAELFPERVGRLVLDSAVDLTGERENPSQAEGFEQALTQYARWCATSEECSIGASADEVLSLIDDFLYSLDVEPMEVDGRQLTQTLGTTGVALFLYATEKEYPLLTMVLEEALEDDGSLLLAAADGLNGREADGYTGLATAFPAMACADRPDEGIQGAYDTWEEQNSKAPVFNFNGGVSLVCEVWTADSAPRLKITAKGAPEILVVGSTGDSATPYKHAQTMAEQLDKGVLLTYEGAGHGASSHGNPCVTETVTDFLVKGTVPDHGKTCKP